MIAWVSASGPTTLDITSHPVTQYVCDLTYDYRGAVHRPHPPGRPAGTGPGRRLVPQLRARSGPAEPRRPHTCRRQRAQPLTGPGPRRTHGLSYGGRDMVRPHRASPRVPGVRRTRRLPGGTDQPGRVVRAGAAAPAPRRRRAGAPGRHAVRVRAGLGRLGNISHGRHPRQFRRRQPGAALPGGHTPAGNGPLPAQHERARPRSGPAAVPSGLGEHRDAWPAPYSTRTRTEWGFTCRADASGEQTQLPLIQSTTRYPPIPTAGPPAGLVCRSPPRTWRAPPVPRPSRGAPGGVLRRRGTWHRAALRRSADGWITPARRAPHHQVRHAARRRAGPARQQRPAERRAGLRAEVDARRGWSGTGPLVCTVNHDGPPSVMTVKGVSATMATVAENPLPVEQPAVGRHL